MGRNHKAQKESFLTGSVFLRVQKAKKRDMGRNIIRLDHEVMDKLKVDTGDIVTLLGKKESVAIVFPGYPQDGGLGFARIDSGIRRNTGTDIDDSIQVYKKSVESAQEIVLAPVTVNVRRNSRFELFVKQKLNHYPVVLGDIISISIGITRMLDFKVVKLVPQKICQIVQTTNLIISGEFTNTEDTESQLPFFNTIGGLDKQIKEIKELIQVSLEHPSIIKTLGIKAPRGILLIGPSGCGKTLLGKAIGNEFEINFTYVSAPEIVSKYHGETEKNLREIFNKAKQKSPSIIFIDQIDILGMKINTEKIKKNHLTNFQVGSQLLALMDGLDNLDEVIVIGATNKVEILDPNLLMENRFSKAINIDYPDDEARLEIFKIYTKDMPLEDKLDFNEITKKTTGFNGADIKGVCREAALSAFINKIAQTDLSLDELDPKLIEEIKITNDDFSKAIEVVSKIVNMRFNLEHKKEVN